MNDIMAQLKENVIQGRITQDDEGIDDTLTGPGVVELTRMALDSKIPVKQIIADGLTAGMEIVGQKFNAKEYYVPDMLASAEAVSEAMDTLKPHLEGSGVASRGKFAIVTVKGDIHDIGKSIIATGLKLAGFEVIDLGRDVAVNEIINKAEACKADIIATSALLTTTLGEQRKLEFELREREIRSKYKTMVGGAPCTSRWAKKIGSDAYSGDVTDAIKKARELMKNGG